MTVPSTTSGAPATIAAGVEVRFRLPVAAGRDRAANLRFARARPRLVRRRDTGLSSAGLGGAVEAAARIAKSLERSARQSGFPKETRPFRAHVTLGRVKGGRGLRELEPVLGRVAAALDATPFSVPSITLYRSELTPSGAIYTVVTRRELATP